LHILGVTDADRVFKALADPSRRQLLDRLYDQSGLTLTALCEGLDMSRQAVTQHLEVLAAASLVATVMRGREKLHYLNPMPIYEVFDRWIRRFERPRLRALDDFKKRLESRRK
jgi:DNA-binding transcriptional ArsR family regulator